MASKSYGWDVRNIAKISPKMVKKRAIFRLQKKIPKPTPLPHMRLWFQYYAIFEGSKLLRYIRVFYVISELSSELSDLVAGNFKFLFQKTYWIANCFNIHLGGFILNKMFAKTTFFPKKSVQDSFFVVEILIEVKKFRQKSEVLKDLGFSPFLGFFRGPWRIPIFLQKSVLDGLLFVVEFLFIHGNYKTSIKIKNWKIIETFDF